MTKQNKSKAFSFIQITGTFNSHGTVKEGENWRVKADQKKLVYLKNDVNWLRSFWGQGHVQPPPPHRIVKYEKHPQKQERGEERGSRGKKIGKLVRK